MATTVVVCPYGLPGELIFWLETQAAAEDIEPAALLWRAVERERRRIDPDATQLDPRTKRTGVMGARARAGADEWIGKDVAEAAGVSPGTLSELVREGALGPNDPGRRGAPSRWSPAQARAAVGVLALRALSGATGMTEKRAIFDLLAGADDAVFRAGRWLVAGSPPRIVSETGLANTISSAGSAVAVLNLATLANVTRIAA